MSKRPVKIAKIRDGVEDLVLRWFQDENRPATTQGVVDALGSRVTKANCQKALDALVESESLLVKEIKKAKFYYLDQTTYWDRINGKLGAIAPQGASLEGGGERSSADAAAGAEEEDSAAAEAKDGEGELDAPENDAKESSVRSIDELRAQYLLLSENIQRQQFAFGALMQRRTPEEAAALITLAQRTVEATRSRLAELQRVVSGGGGGSGGGETGLAVSVEETVKQYHELRQLWRERRHSLSVVLDAVCGEASPAEVAENAGVSEPTPYTLDNTSVPLPRGFTC